MGTAEGLQDRRHRQSRDRQSGPGPRRLALHDSTQVSAPSALAGTHTSFKDRGWSVNYASKIKVTSSEITVVSLKTIISKWDRPL